LAALDVVGAAVVAACFALAEVGADLFKREMISVMLRREKKIKRTSGEMGINSPGSGK
jgi:hypothetical protein